MNWVRILWVAEFFPDQFVYIKDKIYELRKITQLFLNQQYAWYGAGCCSLETSDGIKLEDVFKYSIYEKYFWCFAKQKGAKFTLFREKKDQHLLFLRFEKM